MSTCTPVQPESYKVSQKDTIPGLPTEDNTPAHFVMVRVPGYQAQEPLLETRGLTDSEDVDNPFSLA